MSFTGQVTHLISTRKMLIEVQAEGKTPTNKHRLKAAGQRVAKHLKVGNSALGHWFQS